VPRIRVKICGITRDQDAQLAASLGADAVGLNFFPASTRAVDPDSVAGIVGNLPAFVTVVGLFVNPEVELVRKVLDSGLVHCLQFQGDEIPEFCQQFGVPFIKAIRVADLETARRSLVPFRGICSVILDSYVKGSAGGTGKTFDWSIARELIHDGHNPIILAGGLAADNVADAIAQVAPYAVDLCSGVEARPGIKDEKKMRNFFEVLDGIR